MAIELIDLKEKIKINTLVIHGFLKINKKIGQMIKSSALYFFYSVSTGKFVLISLPPFAYLAKSTTALNCLGSKLSTIFAAVSALAGKSSIN